eukprot:NODE_5828_length_962_cov_39.729440_g5245_i0.p1 GENE.NODE_5828_length_962_cov_39.729440_g5245_i0~~NODE_5828_length_962_cov_39.729440_g5245_i0.p1  ORF type:complete len:169 (-),score=29.95 NODE_5828_length_962_cov_39.729440_g5245_i0:79-585(-)
MAFQLNYIYANGEWPEIISGVPTGKNLYNTFKTKYPDIWISNAGAHAFHLRSGTGLSAPTVTDLQNYANNLTKYVSMMKDKYMSKEGSCLLWKANNVPPPKACPPQHFLHLNKVTIPFMLRAGIHVINPEDLSIHNRMRPLNCDIHMTGTTQNYIAQMTANAIVNACS